MRVESAPIHAPELEEDVTWLNTPHPLRLVDLRDHVVVLDFWTYCCVNCLHTLPVLAAMEARFADQPVVVIGVHAAKFPGENHPERILHAIRRYRVRHPVVVDTHKHIWSQYAVRSWPTIVVVRPGGTIAATWEGEPEATVLASCIADLLAQAQTAATAAADLPAVVDANPLVASDRALAYPGKVVVSETGALWIADSGHHRLVGTDRNGNVHTVAGTGRAGHTDGPLAEAEFDQPQGMALTADGTTLYAADARTHLVRRVDLSAEPGRGSVTTVAGTGRLGVMVKSGRFDAQTLALRSPWDLALDEEAGHLYIAMAGSHQIWRLHLRDQSLEVFAGTGAEALVDGPRDRASFAQPSGLALSSDRKRLYVADCEASAVRVVHTDTGAVETLVGAGLFDFGDADGAPEKARLQHCSGLALSPAGLVVADTYNDALRGVNLRHATVITIWPSPGADRGNGPATDRLNEPGGVAFDRTDRSYVVADTNHHRLVRVTRDASRITEIPILGWDRNRAG